MIMSKWSQPPYVYVLLKNVWRLFGQFVRLAFPTLHGFLFLFKTHEIIDVPPLFSILSDREEGFKQP